MTNTKKFQSLHCHTTLSDGLLSHKEVLDACAENSIEVVAFTDHDIIPSAGFIEELKEMHHPTQFITGIEMSANYVAEHPEDVSNFHIVGLFVDPTNEALKTHCEAAQHARIERGEKMTENISQLGFSITKEDIDRFTEDGALGRPHIAYAILSKKENLKVLDDLVQQLKDAAQTDASLMEMYAKVKEHNNFQRIFDLFLANEAFLDGVYVPYLKRTSMDEAVHLIRSAGGIALLAHWSYYKHKITKEMVEKFAREGRIDGFETVYAFRRKDQTTPIEFDEDMQFLRELTETYSLIEGGGGDFHEPDDFSVMRDPAKAKYTHRTVGLVEQIFQKHPTLNKDWTTLE